MNVALAVGSLTLITKVNLPNTVRLKFVLLRLIQQQTETDTRLSTVLQTRQGMAMGKKWVNVRSAPKWMADKTVRGEDNATDRLPLVGQRSRAARSAAADEDSPRK